VKAVLGYSAVFVGASACVVGICALIAGLRTKDALLLRIGRRCIFVVLAAALVAAGAMEWALISHDFSLEYVAKNNARDTPLLFSITGLWAALEGSILLWAVILGGYLTFAAHRFRRRAADPLVAIALTVGLAVAPEPHPHGVPPADPLHGVRRVHGAVHVRDGGADHRSLR
jgi:cytochrome c-type biogenesis protein CcmF